MDFATIFSILAFFWNWPVLAALCLAVVFGYVLRKYVEKKYRNEAKLLDEIGQQYGDRAVDAVLQAKAQAGKFFKR